MYNWYTPFNVGVKLAVNIPRVGSISDTFTGIADDAPLKNKMVSNVAPDTAMLLSSTEMTC